MTGDSVTGSMTGDYMAGLMADGCCICYWRQDRFWGPAEALWNSLHSFNELTLTGVIAKPMSMRLLWVCILLICWSLRACTRSSYKNLILQKFSFRCWSLSDFRIPFQAFAALLVRGRSRETGLWADQTRPSRHSAAAASGHHRSSEWAVGAPAVQSWSVLEARTAPTTARSSYWTNRSSYRRYR